ncbi:hypothetical protein QUF63_11855 [Anaerolineales bacterium HSG25]|nr:hypothetical protein [Anaerolineales bacterium HSG25]
MTRNDTWFFFSLFIGAAVLAIGLIWSADPVNAQCGSSASSCKTCHETQGKDPVNAEGEWHTQHAFGDFCEFCHAGNVQATEQEAAHQGLALPMEDIAASCQGCHPQDLTERGEKYAAILGIELGADSSGGNSGNSGDSGDSDSGEGDSSGEDDNASITGVAPPLGGEEIDYNLLYAASIAPQPLVSNWGNLILMLMIAVTGVAFFLTAWSWEGWGQVAAAWINDNVKIVSDAAINASVDMPVETVDVPTDDSEATSAPSPTELANLFEQNLELKNLWTKLAHSDSTLLNDLNQILSNEEQGSTLLHAVSRLDLKLATSLKQLNEQERALLMAVAKEM